jgi:rhodanese-related sulfurtransferase
MKIVILFYVSIFVLVAGQYDKVKITPDISSIYVYHKGKAVKVHRIQDTTHKITGEYAKQYRPNKDIQPIKMHKDIRTIGEVELLQFMQDKGNNAQGTLIDVRTKNDYRKESIPSAVNIPAEVMHRPEKMTKIIEIFGAKYLSPGQLDTSNAVDLVVYCHGLWCSKSSEFIHVLLDMGYPAEKIFYYRGGFQMWKILGFTTVTNEER